MATKDELIAELVAANRILANLGVVDAYGHASARHPTDPQRFLLSRSRSPELVTPDDIMEFSLDGQALDGDTRPAYLERFIHGGIYAARPDINAVVHSHADEVVPFTITKQPLIPVLHSAADMGLRVPTWDIREKFGDHTNLLVSTTEQGHDLARRLGAERVVLMRGHGFAAAAPSIYEVVKIAAFMPRNAQILTTALRFGNPIPLSAGEVEALSSMDPTSPAARRAWEFWCSKAGLVNTDKK
jgi:HCOMODA/2-hydroxy-3-carboxy-muconic semialdehyde decarboxylase